MPALPPRWEHASRMRSSLGWGLSTTLLGCNAVLGIPDEVTVLCEQGADCPRGYCDPQGSCDDGQWVLRLGDARDQQLAALDYHDPDAEGPLEGQLVLVGSFEGELDFGDDHVLVSTDGLDAFAVALHPDGRPVWSHRFGGPGQQRATAVDVDVETGTIHVAGEFDGDLRIGEARWPANPGVAEGFVVQLDPLGEIHWSRTFGGTELLEVNDILTANGAPNVVGSYRGTWSQGPDGAADSASRTAGFIVSYDDTATASVSLGLGASEDMQVCCVLLDPLTNNVLLGGRFEGSFMVSESAVISDGVDGFVFFLVENGEGSRELQAVQLGEPLDAFDTDSLARLSLALTSGPANDPGFSVFRLGTDLSTELVRADTPRDTAKVFALTHNRANETLVFGRFTSELDLVQGPVLDADDGDLFVFAIDDQWRLPTGRAWAFGGVGDATPTGIAADDHGYVLVGGTFDGQLVLDNGQGAPAIDARGQRDVFVARLRL